MAEVWGTEVQSGTTRAAKMRIVIEQTNTFLQSKVTIKIYLHTKYAVLDNNNNYYFDMNATSATTDRGSISINHTSNASGGDYDKNVTKLGESTFTYNRDTSAKTINCAAKIANVNYIKATPTVSASFTVPALDKYTVTYNLNGATGTAPDSQTKYYGTTLTLQPSTKNPSRTGYIFRNWNTKADGSGISYSPGASYTSNANTTLYAQWTVITYKVSYNANGGSGAPSDQTKTYDVNLTLINREPNRPNYNFVHWNTKADGSGISYSPGASYTSNANTTLYAQWEIAYTKPRIKNFKVERCGQDGIAAEDGTCVHITASWECDKDVVEVYASWNGQNYGVCDIDGEGKSGTVNIVIGDDAISAEYGYDISLHVRDAAGEATSTVTISSYKFFIDLKPGPNPGVAIGKTAELAGTFDVGLTSRFLGNHYCMASNGGNASEDGYVLVAKINFLKTGILNYPITFVLNRANTQTPMIVHIVISGTVTENPIVSSIRYEGSNYGAFLIHTNPTEFDLYVYKSTTYANVTVQDWYTSKAMDGSIKVTFPGTMVPGTTPLDLPQGLDGYHRATPAVLQSIIDCIMPVGFVLTLYNHKDPNDMYPGTTWTRIQNAFLWGCDASGTIGQTGGEKTHTLTANEMPSHTHSEKLRVHGYSGWADYETPGYGVMFDYNTDNKYFSSGQTRKTALVSAYASTDSAGGDAAHNNMPPYVQVSIWRRTA